MGCGKGVAGGRGGGRVAGRRGKGRGRGEQGEMGQNAEGDNRVGAPPAEHTQGAYPSPPIKQVLAPAAAGATGPQLRPPPCGAGWRGPDSLQDR
jgi:hypothetical protein